MTLRERIAERLRDECWNISAWPDGPGAVYELARMIAEEGFLDDTLGVPEPTLEDVKREAERALENDIVVEDNSEWNGVWVWTAINHEDRKMPTVYAPTLASAYAALRTLPTKGET